MLVVDQIRDFVRMNLPKFLGSQIDYTSFRYGRLRDRYGSKESTPASQVPLVPEEAIGTGPAVPIVSPLEISGGQGMREAVQLLTRMVSIHEQQLESGVDIQTDRTESSKALELASFRLHDVAILWYEACERSRGPDAPPAKWEDFSEAFLAHYFPREVREACLDQFINLKQGTMSVRDYSHKFNSLERYTPDIVCTMRARVHRYFVGLADHLIRDCGVASLSDDVDISCIQTFAHTTEDLSKRTRDTRRNREQSKRAHIMGSYREPNGDFRPPFHRYPPRKVGSVSLQ
ncbi:hypothetical protein MTR67_048062, partial [Solanum verrucosum]